MDNSWYYWRSKTLIPCNREGWEELYTFLSDLVADIAENSSNYGSGYSLNDIDWRVMSFIYSIFSKAEYRNESVVIKTDDVKGILKSVRAASFKKLKPTDGLSEFGLQFAENEGVTQVHYPRTPSVLQLLSEFTKKCSANKGNGFCAFLKCDLRELDRKTSVDMDFCISNLEQEIQDEIRTTDKHLLALKRLKLKRQIAFDCLKGDFWYGGTIKYVSKEGFCYTIHLNRHRIDSGEKFEHNAWWYIMPNYQGVRWTRVKDLTENTLERLNESLPELADSLYGKFKLCNSCYGEGCIGRTRYSLNGQSKITCHGRMFFNAAASDFDSVRKMISVIDEVI